LTKDIDFATAQIGKHVNDIADLSGKKIDLQQLNLLTSLNELTDCDLAIAFTNEKLDEKTAIIKLLEKKLPTETLIAINTESIALSTLQTDAGNPSRVIGLNWVEPAHTTFFLEIIANEKNDQTVVETLAAEAKKHWNKDPYIVKNAISVRSRLFCAMAREAFYLIENGYATVQDIDRACRNDAGYYLPFAGNFRYMDLMGTHSYAEVMKKLNSDLATDTHPPQILNDIIRQGGLGMENNKGFYNYKNGDTADWEKLFSSFSYKIQEIMERYPFNYDDKQPINDN
jgi:3-hydroxybutyryl-CoA dehydrogenase